MTLLYVHLTYFFHKFLTLYSSPQGHLSCSRTCQIKTRLVIGAIHLHQRQVPSAPISVNVSASFVSATQRNSRKRLVVDDRFDPYPSNAKRRAVSPSLQYLRDSHQAVSSPIGRGSISRLPISIPISVPHSAVSSATSSPTIGSNYPPFHRGISITSSPTLRATLSMPSPILRPLGRRREDEEREIEIEGAGEAVSSLSLGQGQLLAIQPAPPQPFVLQDNT